MRARIPEIHAVIDRALASSGKSLEDVSEGRRASNVSDMMRGSRGSNPALGSRKGSALGLSKVSTLAARARAASANPQADTTVEKPVFARATEVSADLCLSELINATSSE